MSDCLICKIVQVKKKKRNTISGVDVRSSSGVDSLSSFSPPLIVAQAQYRSGTRNKMVVGRDVNELKCK